ncbi:MAG: hypothetical protein RLO17_02875 [Cyclobacteriaceae bacterium]
MKFIISLGILILSFFAYATHQLTYYVYYETSYAQGPWSRVDLLNQSGYQYLKAEAYNDLFGTIPDELVHKMLSRLKEKKPSYYNWTFDISLAGDSVTIASKETIANQETIKNEITATCTLNGFNTVTFNFPDQLETWTLDDLTLPYFDLVNSQLTKSSKSTPTDRVIEKRKGDTVVVTVVDTVRYIDSSRYADTKPLPLSEAQNEEDAWITLLLISAVLNVGLFGLLIFWKKSNRSVSKSRKRHGFVTTWLIFMIINFAVSSFYYFFLIDSWGVYLKTNFPEPIEIAFGILSLVNLVLAVMLIRWEKWAFYGLFVTSLIFFSLSFISNMSIGRSSFSLIAIVVLYAILQIKKDGVSAWDFLD